MTCRADAIHRRQHLALLEHGRQFVTVAAGRSIWKVHEAIQRNGRGHLAFDECIHVADVAGHHRDESQHAGCIAPREAARNTNLLALSAAWLRDSDAVCRVAASEFT
jgi:hypothetical protein